MSSSTDSLKKKVCVTVFLDELFEDVEEDGEEEEEEEEEEEKKGKKRKDSQQESVVTESGGKFAEKSFKGPSHVNSDNDVRVNVPSKADAKHSQTQLRPRKHRKESKFSKNSNDSFKNELSKYGYSSCFKVKNEGCEPADSAVSDSDFDLDEFLGLDKWAAKSKSSPTELSERDLSEEFFMSARPELASGKVSSPKSKKNSKRKSNARIEARVELCNKSTQFEGTNHERKTNNNKEEVVRGIILEKVPTERVEEDVLAWEKTQKQIQLILAEARTRYQEKGPCEGDRIRHYDLRSILKECAKTRRSRSEHDSPVTIEDESDEQEMAQSYACVIPHKKQNLQNRPVELKRVWTSERKNAWNDGFESDLSETDCTNHEKDFGLLPIQNDSMVCFTVCVKRKNGESEKAEKKRESFFRKLTASHSSDLCRESSGESIGSKASREPTLVFQAVTHLGDRAILGTILQAEEETRQEKSRKESDLAEEALKSSWKIKERDKNFAEGDTITKLVSSESRFILDFDAKENLFICDEILKHVAEPKVICNEIIVNRAEIKLHSRDEVDNRHASLLTTTASDALAEVLFNQKESETFEKNITDAESEMVFADSEDYFCRKYSIGPASSPSTPRNPLQDICVIEFEDKLSRSKILRRMKTVEILGDSSLNMKNISTEVILICENISSNEVCMEAWHSSACNIRSVSEMKQCYLKDSNDSAMYLIEIPLRFTRTKKEGLSDSDHFCKASDSD